MDIVVNQENVHQIVQAMYENVKSNQHRLDEIEPILEKMAPQVQKLTDLIVENGFAQAVKDNAADLREFKEEFRGFLLTREESCPTAKRAKERQEEKNREESKRITLARLGIAALALLPTFILIIEKFYP